MNNKLYVGNFPWATNEDELGQFFTQVGEVEKAEIIMDKGSNRSKGFGFVTMKTAEEAETALKTLGGQELGGRVLTIRIARPQGERPEKRPSIRQAQRQSNDPPSLSQQIEDFCLGDCIVNESIDFTVAGKGFNLARTS